MKQGEESGETMMEEILPICAYVNMHTYMKPLNVLEHTIWTTELGIKAGSGSSRISIL